MNGRVIQIFCMVVGMVLASSCGDECPVEQPYSVRVSVKDKNYLNISQFPQLSQVDENLPFRTYTGTLWRANLCATFLGNLVYPTPASKMLHFP